MFSSIKWDDNNSTCLPGFFFFLFFFPPHRVFNETMHVLISSCSFSLLEIYQTHIQNLDSVIIYFLLLCYFLSPLKSYLIILCFLVCQYLGISCYSLSSFLSVCLCFCLSFLALFYFSLLLVIFIIFFPFYSPSHSFFFKLKHLIHTCLLHKYRT